jgi:hypothetical protein
MGCLNGIRTCQQARIRKGENQPSLRIQPRSSQYGEIKWEETRHRAEKSGASSEPSSQRDQASPSPNRDHRRCGELERNGQDISKKSKSQVKRARANSRVNGEPSGIKASTRLPARKKKNDTSRRGRLCEVFLPRHSRGAGYFRFPSGFVRFSFPVTHEEPV